jgi:hypothetical protein
MPRINVTCLQCGSITDVVRCAYDAPDVVGKTVSYCIECERGTEEECFAIGDVLASEALIKQYECNTCGTYANATTVQPMNTEYALMQHYYCHVCYGVLY